MKTDGIAHPKTKRLKKILDVPLFHVLGILEGLFCFACQYANDGRIGKYSNDEIADFLEWDGSADDLIAALVASKWLDGEGENITIHDWLDHCPEYVKKRLQRLPAAASGGQRETVAASGGLSSRLQSFPLKENQKTENSAGAIDRLFNRMRETKGFRKPNKTSQRVAMVADLLERYPLDQIESALAMFPLNCENWKPEFSPHIGWLCGDGRVDTILEGVYGGDSKKRDKLTKLEQEVADLNKQITDLETKTDRDDTETVYLDNLREMRETATDQRDRLLA